MMSDDDDGGMMMVRGFWERGRRAWERLERCKGFLFRRSPERADRAR